MAPKSSTKPVSTKSEQTKLLVTNQVTTQLREASQSSPSKKKHQSPPSPGSEVYDLLPAVSIIETACRRPKYYAPSLFLFMPSSNTTRHTIMKTEKAKAGDSQAIKIEKACDDKLPASKTPTVWSVSPSGTCVDLIVDIAVSPRDSSLSTPQNKTTLLPLEVETSSTKAVDNSDEESCSAADSKGQDEGDENFKVVMITPCLDPFLVPLYENLSELP
ncbi:hypothetical protein L208DRAFT_1378037 [Tricholoma matsutake]|nr:hypothetical protein L208DRAFT_1378037 [Tricholoma matsutake 945]